MWTYFKDPAEETIVIAEMTEEEAGWMVLKTQAEAMKRGILVMWTVFERPTDHPHGFLARRFEVSKGVTATTDAITGEVEKLRDIFMRAGLTKLSRHPDDEPAIVEVWL
jgi:hypothetical protein